MADETDAASEKTPLVTVFGQKRQYDAKFKGPIEKRGCTDVICCIIITAYMIGMVIIGIIGYTQGDPKRLLYPTDSDGKVCGIDIPDKSYLHFFDLTKCLTKGASDPFTYVRQGLSCPTPQVCVAECPQKTIAVGGLASFEDLICVVGTAVDKDSTTVDIQKLVSEGKCASYYLKSDPVFYRCFPTVATTIIDSLGIVNLDNEKVNGSNVYLGETAIDILLNLQNLSMQIADELKVVWMWILAGFIISMVASMIYIVLARWITFPLVIFTKLGVLGLLGYACYYTIDKYMELHNNGTSEEIIWRISIRFDDFTRNKTTWLVVGIILIVVTLIIFLIMIFMLHRVRIACALIAEASRAVCSMLSTLFFPILPWILQLIWGAWFLVVLLFLMSNGTKQYQVSQNDTNINLTVGDMCDQLTFKSDYPAADPLTQCLFAKYKENDWLLYFQIFHLFGWLWGSQFIVAFAECSLAGAFASYYWARRKPKDIPSLPVLGSMWRTLSCHTGSLALGAAIIAVVKLIRITLEYIHAKLKENTDNPVANFIMACLKCCFWCLEKCLRFLNKNAYILIAIYGRNFCLSAKEAFSLLIRNPARVVVLNGVTGFILFLGKILVTGGVGVGSFYWFVQYNALEPDKLNYTIVPVLICTFGAYLVTMLFFNVYDMGIDTMFLSFLEDMERNDGSPEKPYFMTKELKKIMSIPKEEHSMEPTRE